MPYISQDRRDILDPHIDALVTALRKLNKGREDKIEGDLNYCTTRLLLNGIKNISQKWKFRFINRITGVLGQVGSEFHRRLKDVYEEECIDKNGDLKEYEAILLESADD